MNPDVHREKTFTHERLAVTGDDPGGLTIFGKTGTGSSSSPAETCLLFLPHALRQAPASSD